MGALEQDKAPLLPTTAPPPAQEHAWDGHVLRCWGKGDTLGWASCALAYYLPCVAWAHNARRLHGQANAWLQAALYCFLFSLFGWIVQLCQVHTVFSQANNKNHQGAHAPAPAPTGAHHKVELTAWDWAFNVSTTLSVLLAIVGICVAAYRRHKMRAALNIPHIGGAPALSCFLDGCTWFWCGCCALAQETRTLWANNVVDGTWHGPTGAQAPLGAATQAPQYVAMA